MRKLINAAALGVALILSVEGAFQLWYRVQFDAWYTPQALAARFSERGVVPRASQFLEGEIASQIVHPYLGYVWGYRGNDRTAIETLGFIYSPNPLPTKHLPDEINLLVTGGSVAQNLTMDGSMQLALNKLLAPKRARIFGAALPGYKQPQQVNALAFLVAAGATFDIIINLDGFNEIVLPYNENHLAGIQPIFPRWWNRRVSGKGMDLKALGEATYLNQLRAKIVNDLSHKPKYKSAIVGFFIIQHLNQINARSLELQRILNSTEVSYEQSGPFSVNDGTSQREVISKGIEVWARSSQLMQSISVGIGAEYFHVLQPNQYLPGSKPFSTEESSQYVRPELPWSKTAILGYPMIVARGQELLQLVPNYMDATGVFSSDERTLYSDNCCHLNPLGNKLLAEFIAKKVLSQSAHARETPNGK